MVIKCYKYAEKANSSAAKQIAFGWVSADSINDEEDYIASYHSRSKSATEEEAQRSIADGTVIATVSDYKLYFTKLTGQTPEVFYDKWSDDEDALKVFLESRDKSLSANYLFLLKLARLLATGKKFVMHSRGFKYVKPDKKRNQEGAL